MQLKNQDQNGQIQYELYLDVWHHYFELHASENTYEVIFAY